LKSSPDTVSIPVIIYSGRTDHDEKIESFRFGADDYLEKPFDMDMLMRRVEHHMFKTTETVRKSGVVATAAYNGADTFDSFDQKTPVRWMK
jgi:DNA-binding response OmpR family regulator